MPSYQMIRYGTLADIVNDIAAGTGYSAAISDPAGSTNPAVAQMVWAVNKAAAFLSSDYLWEHLVKQAAISVIADSPGQEQKAFPMPADFVGFVVQTQNDRTVRLPAIGPLSAAQWEAIQSIVPFVTFQLMWRYFDGNFYVLFPPQTAHDLRFEYLSDAYVIDADNPTLYKNEATKNGDTILFDFETIASLARAKWQEVKGFDSSAAMRDFNNLYYARRGRKQSAPVLSLLGSPMSRPFYNPLSIANLPQTGYGN